MMSFKVKKRMLFAGFITMAALVVISSSGSVYGTAEPETAAISEPVTPVPNSSVNVSHPTVAWHGHARKTK